MYIYHN